MGRSSLRKFASCDRRTGNTLSHCGQDLKERLHRRHGVQKLERGSGEVRGLPEGRVKPRNETLVMVLGCPDFGASLRCDSRWAIAHD